MASIGLFDIESDCPTYASIVLFAKNPKRFLPGCFIQFVRFNGIERTDEIDDERRFEQCYFDMLPQLETFVEMSIIKKHPVPVSTLREELVYNYPFWAVRELLMNGAMHRDLQSNMPLRLYEYNNRLEIMNPGGLYGNARPENFPMVNDYRNPIIAGAMKILGYVNMFNRGVSQVVTILKENGNPVAQFNINLITAFEVTVEKSTDENFLYHYSLKGNKMQPQLGTSHTPDGNKSHSRREQVKLQTGTSQSRDKWKSRIVL